CSQLRSCGSQHVRPHGNTARAQAVAPAYRGRPEPRHWASRSGTTDGACGACSRRRWIDHRGAPQSRSGRFGWRADSLPRSVQPAGVRVASDRRGNRALDCYRKRHARGAPRGSPGWLTMSTISKSCTALFIALLAAAACSDGAPRSESEGGTRSEEHTSELQSRENLVCRLLLEKKKKN